tara:strand:+ start:8024 stop:10069 length:2046 start_codon:yes stop_codon:yes gene_type:complete
MALLLNCNTNVEESTQIVSSGTNDYNTVYFNIVPDEGFAVAALDFQDFTPSDTPGINFPIVFQDLIGPYHPDNKVVVTVDLLDSYTISEDTVLDIDIGGKAQEIKYIKNLTVFVVEDISNWQAEGFFPTGASVSFSVTPSTDNNVSHALYENQVELGGWGAGGQGAVNNINDKFHVLDFSIDPATNDPNAHIHLADITLTANHSNSGFTAYFMSGQPAMIKYFQQSINYNQAHDDKFQWEFISSTQTEVAGGEVTTQYKFKLSYKEYDITGYDNEPYADLATTFAYDPDRVIAINSPRIGATINKEPGVTHYIDGVDTEVVGQGPFNNWPTAGVVEGDGKVTVKGQAGAEFEIKLLDLGGTDITIEVDQETGVITKQPVPITGVDFFGGEMELVAASGTQKIPDMSNGIGFVTYKLPEIPKYSPTATFVDGFTSWGIVVEAKNTTAIRSQANVTADGELLNGDELGSILKNVYHQFAPVNINVTALAPTPIDGTMIYSANNYNPTYQVNKEPYIKELVIGSKKNQTIKVGIPGRRVIDLDYFINTSNQQSGQAEYNFEFRLRVTSGSGVFSMDSRAVDVVTDEKGNEVEVSTTLAERMYSFSSDLFEPSHPDNKDRVDFFNLRAWIGQGISDKTTDQYATVTGTIKYVRFGRLSQIYTLRLDKIFLYGPGTSVASGGGVTR